ncbi:MAG: hypothetical protein N2645_23975 [Clostridia bacterium]|nr:hypothetical protein [Clostridia bacterium]
MKRMTILGIGHKAAGVIGLYLIIVFIVDRLFLTQFKITENAYPVLVKVGVMMGVVGFIINLLAAFQMLKAYKNDKLATRGLYAVFLNPMYTMQLLITLPGIMLLFNSWIVMTTLIAAVITVKMFVKEEEKYLEERFGSAYSEYRQKVLFKFL